MKYVVLFFIFLGVAKVQTVSSLKTSEVKTFRVPFVESESKAVYKLVHKAEGRLFVYYSFGTLKKGFELKPEECLYIKRDDFRNLSIALYVRSEKLAFCDSEEELSFICTPSDYTLVFVKDSKICFEDPSQVCASGDDYDSPVKRVEFPYSSELEFQDFSLIKKYAVTETDCLLL